MQSAVYGELLHGTVRILTAAHQLNITVRCQLFKFALQSLRLNHHGNVPSGLVLQQKLNIRVVHTRAAGFGVSIFKCLSDRAVNLFGLAKMPYSEVIQERLKCSSTFSSILFAIYFSTSSRCS